MVRIQDAVDYVLCAMRSRGCTEGTLQHNRWSVYNPIINYHRENGTDYCSDELLESLCKMHEVRYSQGKVSRKYYRSFVTAAFRIRSYVNTGEVDFSVVKDSKLYKPRAEYQELIDAALRESGASQSHQYKLSIGNSSAFLKSAIRALLKWQIETLLTLFLRLQRKTQII